MEDTEAALRRVKGASHEDGDAGEVGCGMQVDSASSETPTVQV